MVDSDTDLEWPVALPYLTARSMPPPPPPPPPPPSTTVSAPSQRVVQKKKLRNKTLYPGTTPGNEEDIPASPRDLGTSAGSRAAPPPAEQITKSTSGESDSQKVVVSEKLGLQLIRIPDKDDDVILCTVYCPLDDLLDDRPRRICTTPSSNQHQSEYNQYNHYNHNSVNDNSFSNSFSSRGGHTNNLVRWNNMHPNDTTQREIDGLRNQLQVANEDLDRNNHICEGLRLDLLRQQNMYTGALSMLHGLREELDTTRRQARGGAAKHESTGRLLEDHHRQFPDLESVALMDESELEGLENTLQRYRKAVEERRAELLSSSSSTANNDNATLQGRLCQSCSDTVASCTSCGSQFAGLIQPSEH